MSLGIALNSALTGLNSIQSALQVASNNVSNASTEGFTKKSVETLPLLLAGQGAGTSLSDVSRTVNDVLVRDMRVQLTSLGGLRVEDEYFTRMQDLFGSLASGTSVSANITKLANAFEALAASPEEPAIRQQVVAAAEALTRQFNDMGSEIQTMRADADKGISDAITVINTELGQIQQLNEQIARAVAGDQPTAPLLDQRDKSLNTLSEYLDFTTFTRATGEVVIVSKSGRTLLDGQAPALTHSPAAAVDNTVTYPGGFDAIDLRGTDITTEITSGQLGALIKLRDTTLPNLQSELNTLASGVFDQINAIHNDGTAFPPPNTLTGSQTVAAGDPFAGTGTTRIAVVDANGDLVAPPIELDLTTYATVGAVQTALNTALGANGTASIVGGNLVIDATNATHGIVINENNTSIGGRGFSHYFGLNDFFTGDPTTNLSRNIAVRSDISASPSLIAHGEFNSTAAIAGDTAVTIGDNLVAQRMANKFGENLSFAASGNLSATTTTFADYGAQMLSVNAAQAAETTDTKAFKEVLFSDIRFRSESFSGVNLDEEMANLVELQNAFGAVAQVISVTSDLMQIVVNLPN